MLTGFTPPFTPTGRSSLVAAPPWHYAGTVFSLRFPVNPKAAQALLPEDFGEATGAACGHFCEWQATTDGSELLDPVYAQYKEFFVRCPCLSLSRRISLPRNDGDVLLRLAVTRTDSFPQTDRGA